VKQFILNEKPRRGLIRLTGDDYHYLVRVRRLKPGDTFTALPPGGTALCIKVLSLDGNELLGQAQQPALDGVKAAAETGTIPDEAAAPGIPPIILFQALPKGAKADLIVRQAVEGALSEVVIFVSEHSVGRPSAEALKARLERWRRIVKEARQQSGSALDTKVCFLPSLDEALLYWKKRKTENSRALLLHERPRAALEQGTFHDYLSSESDLVVLATGPEGGFSDAELRSFLDAGFKTLRIGDTILRTETAALYGAAAVRIILLEKAAWKMSR
jgi:16S rRNA (uracil1498-N3)-methyltransferase